MERRTKIVATIGPASRDPEVLVRMVDAGMDVARLNFSHGTADLHAETAQRVREAAGRAGRPVAILQDLPGPKLRIGALKDDTAELAVGDRVTFVCGNGSPPGDARRMSIAWDGLATPSSPARSSTWPTARCACAPSPCAPATARSTPRSRSAAPSPRARASTSPGPLDILPAVPEEDLEHLRAGQKIGVDLVALSFVRRPEDVLFVREHTRTPLIAKIEKPQGVERAEEILKVSDCVMVARGDLGVEMPIEEVPMIQKRLLALAGSMARPVDHGDPDARLDGHLLAPDARRGRRRGQRDPRRDRRGHALPGDRGRRAPGAGHRDHGRVARTDRARGALRALERDARAPRRARPRLHDRALRLRRRARAQASTRSSSPP
jgi:pyruvate kinase